MTTIADSLTPDGIAGLASAMETLNGLADRFGRTITGAFSRAIVSGKSFEDVLRGIGLRLVDIALQAALKPVSSLIGSLFSGITGSLTGALTGVRAFADGGVVGTPTYFPTGGGLGLMGEAGPEAVMPLARGPDGKLGVRGGGGVTVNVSIATPDAESFRRSEAQVTATLARAVARGRRGL